MLGVHGHLAKRSNGRAKQRAQTFNLHMRRFSQQKASCLPSPRLVLTNGAGRLRGLTPALLQRHQRDLRQLALQLLSAASWLAAQASRRPAPPQARAGGAVALLQQAQQQPEMSLGRTGTEDASLELNKHRLWSCWTPKGSYGEGWL